VVAVVLHHSPNIIWVIKSRRMRWVGHVSRTGERRGAYRVLVGKREGKRLPGRPRCRWEDTIKTYLQEVGWWDMDWIDLAENRKRCRAFVNEVMILRVPFIGEIFLTSRESVSF
jgi:hypothetical protein